MRGQRQGGGVCVEDRCVCEGGGGPDDDDDDDATTDGDTDDDDDDVTEDGDADGDIDPTDGDDPDGDLEGECTPATAAADCQGGQAASTASAPPAKRRSIARKPGLRAGVCGACDSATDCRDGEGCRNDLCGSCLSPADCREGEGCRAGVCGACVEAADCAGLLCEEIRSVRALHGR